MPLLLPNLDDRTWADLVDEGRALIPVYGPEWTDQNYHDPGITLVELLAWIAEMDIYQLNQISDRDRLKFLSLVGVAPKSPLPAHVVLGLNLLKGGAPVSLPAGLEFAGSDPSGVETRYRIQRAITLAPGGLEALQCLNPSGYQNLTPAWRRGAAFYPFGPSPLPGAEFYLGITDPLPPHVPVQCFFTFADGHSGWEQRQRLLREALEMSEHCRPPFFENPCKKMSPVAVSPGPEVPKHPSLPPHYGVRTVWEYQAEVGGAAQWVPLDPAKDEVEDETRAFTLDGPVTFRLPGAMAAANVVGAVSKPYCYLRCRFEVGRYDAAPLLQDVAYNGVYAEQAVSSGMSLFIDPKATILYSPQGPPKPNDETTLRVELDSRKTITRLAFGGGAPGDPKFLILDFEPPTGGAGGLVKIEGVFLGFGNGLPNQRVSLPDAPVEYSSLHLYTLENDAWYDWELRADFDSSTRKDFHAVCDPTAGAITFGNGEKGRVPPELRTSAGRSRDKCLIFATYRATRAQGGNLPARAIDQLADTPHNRAFLYDPAAVPDGWTKLKSQLRSITNPLPASGGAAAETVEQAAAGADQLVEQSGRAVTLQDYERLALDTPGTRVARAKALSNLHPSFPCFRAPGMITVIIAPYLPQSRPVPTPGLLRAVSAFLRPRRVIGTRVEVVGPKYLEVTVHASLQSKGGSNRANVEQAVVQALNDFLDPLHGGPDRTGWPFGRNIYRSEIMKVIDEVPGVDYVVFLELIAGCCGPQCGNVCLGPTWLVAAGAHQITVL